MNASNQTICCLLLICFPVFSQPQGGDEVQLVRVNGAEEPLSTPATVMVVDQQGWLWVGTEQGLARYDGYDFKVFRHNGDLPRSLSNNRVNGLCVDGAGRLWVATDHGLNRLNRDRDDFTSFRKNPSHDRGLSDDEVRTLLPGRKGGLWVGTAAGIDFLAERWLDSEGPVHFQHFRDFGLQGTPRVSALFQDPDQADQLWVGTEQGVLRLIISSGVLSSVDFMQGETSVASHPDIRDLAGDGKGGLWIASLSGLDHVDLRSGELRHFHDEDSPDLTRLRALEVKGSQIWVGGDHGLKRFDPDGERFSQITGLIEPSRVESLLEHQGILWLGSSNGLFKVALDHSSAELPVVFTDLHLDERDAPETIAGELLSKPIHRLSTLEFPSDQNTFSLAFSALRYHRPESLRYAYKLEGFDTGWTETDANHRMATYKDLPSSIYRLRVKAADEQGTWSTAEAVMDIRIKPGLPSKTVMIWVLFLLVLIGVSMWWRSRLTASQLALDKERREVEEEHQLVEQLRQVDKLKDEFLASTSNELRTPLDGIMGVAQSLIDGATGELPAETRNNLAMIVSRTRQLAGVVDNLRDFSQLKNKGLKLRRKAVDLQACAAVILEVFRPLAERKKVQLINDIPAHLPPVDADEERLQQILFNLVDNAVKFTEDGEVRIEAQGDDQVMTFTVTDSGIGIPEQELELVFDTFERRGGISGGGFGGAGLGLTIVRHLIELHGGSVKVVSALGEGARFTLTIPLSSDSLSRSVPKLSSEPITLAEAATRLDPAVKPKPVMNDEGQRFHLLVVDDDPVSRQVLINYLSLAGYRYTEAGSGREALHQLETQHFDMVLLDLMMPQMTGHEVSRKIRERFTYWELPIIFLCTRNQIVDLETSVIDAGANDYLIKPSSRGQVLTRVRAHLAFLDTNRNLEQKVADRTEQLERRNLEILQTQSQLIVQEKMASLGTLTTGIAHELKNPLNFVNNFAGITRELAGEMRQRLEQFDKELTPTELSELDHDLEDLQQNTARILFHGERAIHIVHAMMDVARGDPGRFAEADINLVVDEFTNMTYQGMVPKQEIRVALEKSYDPKVGMLNVAAQNLSRVVINLVSNAIEAVLDRGMENKVDDHFEPIIWVSTERRESEVRITIKDNGGGIDPEEQGKIFNPFHTTKPQGSGHIGLGLYISYDIMVHQHGGRLEVSSETGQTTTMTMVIPTSA